MSQVIIPMSLRNTRMLSVFVYGVLLIAYPADAILPAGPGALSLALSFFKLAALLGCIVLFLGPYSLLGNAPDIELDERERIERAQGYIRAFQILVFTLIMANAYLIAANLFSWWQPTLVDFENLLGALVIAALALPGTVLAWQARPPLAEADVPD